MMIMLMSHILPIHSLRAAMQNKIMKVNPDLHVNIMRMMNFIRRRLTTFSGQVRVSSGMECQE
jgi:hypothetical protein